MIKLLTIQNFQSHAKTELQFHEGVNIIVGPTDSGKSAIIRALRWLVWNRPSGDAIRSTWGGKTEVICKTEDGDIIRIKDKVDQYQLYRSGQALDFKAFGTSVPEEISGLLNINEINLQQQLDSPFLLSDSPGEVAQHFNKVAKLDKIDTGLQRINSSIRSTSQTIEFKADQLKNLKEEVKQFDYLEQMEVDVEVLEELDHRCTSLLLRQTKLETLTNDIKDCSATIEEESEILAIEPLLDTILAWIEKRNKLQDRVENIVVVLDEIIETEKSIEYYKEFLPLEKEISQIELLITQRKERDSNRYNLNSLISQIIQMQNHINATVGRYERLHKEFEDNFPDVCPLCGKPK